MKANELMIGDWLKHYNGTPVQVTKITTEHFACAENGGVNCWEYNNKYEPIFITSEILEKNGWIKSELNLDFYCGNLEYKNYNIQIHNNQDSLNTNNKWLIHIETIYYEEISQSEITYIHQLQHVLKLCGIDKEITLK